MHYAGKIISFQRLPGRDIASNLSTYSALEGQFLSAAPWQTHCNVFSTGIVLARFVPFSGFLTDALQALVYMHRAGEISSFSGFLADALRAFPVSDSLQTARAC
jgi:hypothetical protein